MNKAGRMVARALGIAWGITGSFSSLLVRMDSVKSKRVFGFLGLACFLLLSGCSVGVSSPSSSAQTGGPLPSTPASIAVSVAPGFTDLIAGSSLQLSANVAGDSADKGVTWSVLPASCVCGMIDSTGKYSAPKIPPVSPWVQIVATSIADPTKSGDAGIFLFAAPSGLSVSPYIGSVQVNASRQFSATTTTAAQQFVSTTSASSPTVTWSLTGTECTGAGCGSIDSTGTYTAPATVPNPPNVKVMALVAANPPLIGSADVTISNDAGNSNNSRLKGQYAFLVKGLNDDGNAALAGSFIADGNGNIGNGTGNYVFSDSLEWLPSLTLTGTYSVNFDNRALVVLTVKNPGPPTTFTQSFSFALGDFQGGVANRGHLVEIDDLNLWATGVLARQDPTAFSTAAISGSYAFEFTGSGSTSYPITSIGRFNASGGTMTTGHVDAYGLGVALNGSGTPTWAPDMPFGGVYQVSSDGSGSAAFSFASSVNPGFSRFALYVISANELFFIEQNDSSKGGVSGLVLKQSEGPFSMASLKGPSVFHLTGAVAYVVPSGSVAVGLETFDGSGGFTGSVERNNQGSITTGTSLSGTYALDPNGLGRGQLNLTGDPQPKPFYMVGPGKAFLIDSAGYEAGMLEPQNAPPFNSGSIVGNYAIGTLPWDNWNIDPSVGVLSADGVGVFKGTTDSHRTTGRSFDGSYVVAASGRTTMAMTSDDGSTSNWVFYLVSSSKAVGIEVSPTAIDSAIRIIEK